MRSAEAEEFTRKVGSPYWMSPEMLSGEPYTEATDVYSLAIVLWEILTGSTPFPQASRSDLKRLIVECGERPTIPTNVPAVFKQVLESGWQTDARRRPTAQHIVNSLEAFVNSQEQPNASAAAASSRRPTS
jgi:serine/threonine protein kinase